MDDPSKSGEKKRTLGTTICKGSAVMSIYPTKDAVEIDNPF